MTVLLNVAESTGLFSFFLFYLGSQPTREGYFLLYRIKTDAADFIHILLSHSFYYIYFVYQGKKKNFECKVNAFLEQTMLIILLVRD